MPKLELTEQEFSDLHDLYDKARKNVSVPKDILGKLLRDHAVLNGEVQS